jgi:hypothetical protein
VDGILQRVASWEDTFMGKMKAWSDRERRHSKRIKDLGDLARLVGTRPYLLPLATDDLNKQMERPRET